MLLSTFLAMTAKADTKDESGKVISLIENGFYELDINQDKSVSKKEAKGIVSTEDFTLADSNHDGKLSKKEYIHHFNLKQRAEAEQ